MIIEGDHTDDHHGDTHGDDHTDHDHGDGCHTDDDHGDTHSDDHGGFGLCPQLNRRLLDSEKLLLCFLYIFTFTNNKYEEYRFSRKYETFFLALVLPLEC